MNKLTNDIYDRSSYNIYWRYTNHLTLKMSYSQIVKTSDNVVSNSPSQDYTHLDDPTLLNYVSNYGYNIIMILCLKTIILLSYCYSCLLKKIGILNFLLQNQRAGYLNKAKSNLDFVSQQSLFLHCELYRSGQVLLFFDIVTLTLFWTVLICVHCMSGSAKMEVTCNVIWSSCCWTPFEAITSKSLMINKKGTYDIWLMLQTCVMLDWSNSLFLVFLQTTVQINLNSFDL